MRNFIKSLKVNYRDWDDFMSTVNFYKFNPHSIPGIMQILCKMGRHDYECQDVLYDDQGDAAGARLQCFYCLKQKHSYI